MVRTTDDRQKMIAFVRELVAETMPEQLEDFDAFGGDHISQALAHLPTSQKSARVSNEGFGMGVNAEFILPCLELATAVVILLHASRLEHVLGKAVARSEVIEQRYRDQLNGMIAQLKKAGIPEAQALVVAETVGKRIGGYADNSEVSRFSTETQ